MPDDRSPKIVFGPRVTVEDMTVRLSPELGAAFRELLTEEGIEFGEVIVLSKSAAVVDILAPYLTGGGFLLLRSAIIQLIRRNQGNRFSFKVRDQPVEADGYSFKKLEDVVGEFVATLDDQARADAKAWNKWKGKREGAAIEDRGSLGPGSDKELDESP